MAFNALLCCMAQRRKRTLTLVCLVLETIIRPFHAQHGPGPDLMCFIAFPASSAIWLALMDSTCTFQILCAWNRGGEADGGNKRREDWPRAAWPHPPSWAFESFWVMKIDRKQEYQAQYQHLNQLWFHSKDIRAMWGSLTNVFYYSLTMTFLFSLPHLFPFFLFLPESEAKPWWILMIIML